MKFFITDSINSKKYLAIEIREYIKKARNKKKGMNTIIEQTVSKNPRDRNLSSCSVNE